MGMRGLLAMAFVSIASAESSDARPPDGGPVPTGVVFQKETLFRSDGFGDNWCLTWARDDAQITAMDDGNWLQGEYDYHAHLYRVVGGPRDFRRENIPGFPQIVQGRGSWFAYGLIAVDGVLYATLSKTPLNHWSGPFRGLKLLKSPDNGETWFRVNREGKERRIGPWDDARHEVNEKEMFFLEEFGRPHQEREAYPFSFVAFVQEGRDNAAARDGYLYIYSPEGSRTNHLLLARAPKERLGVRAAWEYFVRHDDGEPVWSADIRERGPVHVFPEKSRDGRYFGWYSWLPSVVWNGGLGLYLMVNGGTYGGHGMTDTDEDYYDAWMHTKTGSLGFWYSERPYGPWHEFFYTDDWTVDDPGNRTYQPKLSPKWIREDGREMVLIWSDAMMDRQGRSHSVHYTWNQMAITIQTE